MCFKYRYAIKSLVKRATTAITNITKENAEYFELKHRARNMERSIDDWGQYFENVRAKLQVIAKYFKEKEMNEMK